MSEHRRYVAGFLFFEDKVLLVRKTHPKWQAGLMNAVGGEIEDGESPSDAMAREFCEEAGLVIQPWEFFVHEEGPGYEVYFYRYRLKSLGLWKPPPHNDKKEELEWCDYAPKHPVIGNLHWMIPLALDPRPIRASIKTTGDIRKIATW